MNYIRITVRTTTEGSDIISEILANVSSGGVIIEDKQDIKNYNRPKEEWDYIDEELLENYEDEVLVRGFVSEEDDVDEALSFVRKSVEEVFNNNPTFPWGTLCITNEIIKDENWGETWKKYYKPFKPGKIIVIKPSWEDYEKQEGDIVLELDPGAAFGTGSHETTKMCIGFLEDYVKEDMSVMDVGCGTGILAMCAYLLGAKPVKAIDIDAEAVKVAKKNMENAGFNISVECGNLLENFFGKVDLIVANIIADAVMMLAQSAKNHLNDGGIYITSGIINERADEVEAKILSVGFKKLIRKSMGEWTAFVWSK